MLIPCMLTSATLSIGGDFSHFMHQTGIDLLEQRRLLTVSKASPFDYENHALLYLPEDMPFPDTKNRIYMEAVLVRLPFPTPDPVSEYERTLHDDFYSYLSERIVPDMLIKLRQWIGRGIRRETDTCVFSILDSRAAGRYKNDILAALPDMPVTDRIDDVGRFLLSHKDGSYFDA